MTTLGALAVLMLAQPVTPLELPTEEKDALQLLTDGKGHFIAVNFEDPTHKSMFTSGDGKTFYKVRTMGGGRNGDLQWDVTMWDPRVMFNDTSDPQLWMRESGAKFEMVCAYKTTALTHLSAADAKKVFSAATFLPYKWTRIAEKLLRDEEGTYYFVDRFRSERVDDRRDFRVFVGPRGRMKQLPLKDIVDDPEGMILTTKSGNLRLITSEGKLDSKWVLGGKETKLTAVPLEKYDTTRLIYMDLGPYSGQRLGTPCDDFM